MSASRLAFLSSLVAGSTVHFAVDHSSRVVAVVVKTGKRGFDIQLPSFSVVSCDVQGYQKGNNSMRVEDPAGQTAGDWNDAKAARDQTWRDNRPANAPFFE